ncbi:MAG: hypothetical protein WCA48_25825, partial [Pseudomonas gingeri]
GELPDGLNPGAPGIYLSGQAETLSEENRNASALHPPVGATVLTVFLKIISKDGQAPTALGHAVS